MNIEKIETFKYYESFNGSYGVKLPDQELEYIHSLCMNSYVPLCSKAAVPLQIGCPA